MRDILETKRKALKINLEPSIYGTFAEIGAGQEVARNFFVAGAASGTIAKTMSAYDMVFSDEIYGIEEDKRYVSKSRVSKMLDHEFHLLEERLTAEKYNDRRFFAYANTVTTINFKKTNDPHGWMGIRFQSEVGAAPNEIIIHVRLLDSDVNVQQNVLGTLGVNLVYAAYYYHADAQTMIESLVDNISYGAVEIDVVNVNGPDFKLVNERLINLYLIAKGFSSAAVFDPQGEIHQSKDVLYKKNVMILRTKYRQKSTPNFDLFNKAVEQFKRSQGINDDSLLVCIEVLMSNSLNEDNEIKSGDLVQFAQRAEEMCATGNHVIVSNFTRNNKLAKYLSTSKPLSVGISTNVANLKRVFDASRYNDNYTDELLSYVSDMFNKRVQLYAYPYLSKDTNEVITLQNMPVSDDARPLFEFLVQNNYITDIENYDLKYVKTV